MNRSTTMSGAQCPAFLHLLQLSCLSPCQPLCCCLLQHIHPCLVPCGKIIPTRSAHCSNLQEHPQGRCSSKLTFKAHKLQIKQSKLHIFQPPIVQSGLMTYRTKAFTFKQNQTSIANLKRNNLLDRQEN